MTVIYRSYGSSSAGTQLKDSSLTTRNTSEILVTKITSNQMVLSFNYSGTPLTLTYDGFFDLSRVDPSSIKSATDLLEKGGLLPHSISSYTLSALGAISFKEEFIPGLTFKQVGDLIDGTSEMPNILAGNDVYYSSSDAAGNANESAYLYGGNDIYYQNHKPLTKNDKFYGGDGIDTAVYAYKAANYTISTTNTVWNYQTQKGDLPGFTVIDKTKVINSLDLNQVERLKFTDTNVALDVGPTQNAGSVYMIYKAAFNRAPDASGMGYWLAQKDAGSNIVTNIAQGFVNSAEFTAKYGTNPSNASYIDKLYQNVLGRSGDAGGVAYWNQQLDNGSVSKAAALAAFATLPEGASNVASLIANGIAYTEFVG